MRLDKLTVKAQEAIQAAQSLADQANHQAIEPEHLLLALLQQQEGVVGPLLAKLQSGEYEAAFFVSGAVRALIDQTSTGDVLDYRYFEDATALPGRGIGVTTGAESPNAARVFQSWLLSPEGQAAACDGGFTPYREEVDCPTGLPAIEAEVGEGEAPTLLRLMDALEEHDDVDSVHANFDVPEEVLERVAAAG